MLKGLLCQKSKLVVPTTITFRTSLGILNNRTQYQIRTMASSTSTPKLEWLVILPDYEGALEKRMAVRPKHLENILPHAKSGLVNMGGGYMSEPPEEGKPLPLIGSAMLCHADTKEEVMQLIESDVYAKNGVWDLSKIQIYPFKTAVRNAL